MKTLQALELLGVKSPWCGKSSPNFAEHCKTTKALLLDPRASEAALQTTPVQARSTSSNRILHLIHATLASKEQIFFALHLEAFVVHKALGEKLHQSSETRFSASREDLSLSIGDP